MSDFVIDYCLICDDIRAEAGGKFALMGFLGKGDDAEIALDNPAIPLRSLAFLVAGKNQGQEADLPLTISMENINGSAMIGPTVLNVRFTTGRFNVVFNFHDVVFQEPGEYTLRVKTPAVDYRATFKVLVPTHPAARS